MESRSKPCVFIGYSLHQSAYHCLDPSTSRIYVSRHVQFVESQFPFSKQPTPTSSPFPTTSSTSADTWISAPSPVSPIISSSTISPQPPIPTSISIPPPLPPHALPQSTPTSSSSSTTATTPPSPALSSPPSPQFDPPSNTVANPPTHPMITRAKNNIHKPLVKLNLHTRLSASVDAKPTSVTTVLLDPRWRKAMSDECDALVKNGTWDLVPPESAQNIVGCKWIFRIKRHTDGTIERFKA